MTSLMTYDLPISGMTCASCAGRVERALSKVVGVANVSINLASERARIEAPTGHMQKLVKAVTQAGYEVPSEQLDLALSGMTCASCAGRIERVLAQQTGVLAVSVNFAS